MTLNGQLRDSEYDRQSLLEGLNDSGGYFRVVCRQWAPIALPPGSGWSARDDPLTSSASLAS